MFRGAGIASAMNDWLFRRQTSYSEISSSGLLWRRSNSGGSVATDDDTATVATATTVPPAAGCFNEEMVSVSPDAGSDASLRMIEPSNTGLAYLKRGIQTPSPPHTHPLNQTELILIHSNYHLLQSLMDRLISHENEFNPI